MPRRSGWIYAICFILAAAPSIGHAQADLVFEGHGERLDVVTSALDPVFMHGNPSVQFRLDEASSKAFRELTGEMIGETLAVYLCDIRLLEAEVREELDGRGILNVPSIEAAIAITDVVNGAAPCQSLEAHFDG